MRHLTTDELLLYAEGELESRGLCSHVRDCVDCKARLVDLQEIYVHATAALRPRCQGIAAQPPQMRSLRLRLAAEVELLSAHLGTEELLLAVEDQLGAGEQAHLRACGACQDRAAELHVQLAEIECELHAQRAFELSTSRRAAALAALRERLALEVESRTVAARPWVRLPRLGSIRVPAFASYALAGALAGLIAWTGWMALSGTGGVTVAPETQIAETGLVPVAVPTLASEPPSIAAVVSATPAGSQPTRFTWTAATAQSLPPPAPQLLADVTAPRLARMPETVGIALPTGLGLPTLPEPPSDLPLSARAVRVPLPERVPQPVLASPDAVIEGSWLLARADLWREPIEVGGSDQLIRFSGFLRSEKDRVDAERRLRAVANGRPLVFALAVRQPASVPFAAAPSVGVTSQPSGGLVRSSLLQHYEDAARRSFQPLDRALLEGELDRYVSGVFRHGADLLAHVHALHGLLNRSGIDLARSSEGLRRVVRFHLRGILDHEAGIYRQLSEALPRQYWAYGGAQERPASPGSLGALSRDLLKDTLALDRALATMFFGPGEALDARANSLSTADLLLRVRLGARHLRSALGRPLD